MVEGRGQGARMDERPSPAREIGCGQQAQADKTQQVPPAWKSRGDSHESRTGARAVQGWDAHRGRPGVMAGVEREPVSITLPDVEVGPGWGQDSDGAIRLSISCPRTRPPITDLQPISLP